MEAEIREKYLQVAADAVAAQIGTTGGNVRYIASDRYTPGFKEHPWIKSLMKIALQMAFIAHQVDDVLVVDNLVAKDDDYRTALAQLVEWNIKIENDPAVSPTARARVDEMSRLQQQARDATFDEIVMMLRSTFEKNPIVAVMNFREKYPTHGSFDRERHTADSAPPQACRPELIVDAHLPGRRKVYRPYPGPVLAAIGREEPKCS